MKKLIALIAFVPLIAFAGGEMKEVCKKIKVHKKLDGTAIPPKK